ncbi:MAG: hypothetical protein KDB27_34600, partial [Planctomycetales bacterium]|nr:hypothetical protein [Planctomycetales bacterium]
MNSVYEELTRNMNEQERGLLNERTLSTVPAVTLAGTALWLAVWTGGMLFCVLAIAGLIILDHPVLAGILGGPIALSGIVCLYAIIMLLDGHFRLTRYHREFVRRDDIPVIKAAIDAGQVFVKKVSAEAVIEIAEFEDEGSGYIYDVGDGKSLFLKGQWFYPVCDDKPWPNSEFELVRTVHGNVWIGIFCSGVE